MSRPRPPYLHRTITRHGKVAYYVWRRPGPKVRIREEYGTPEFMNAYYAALWGEKPPQKPKEADGTLAALMDAYQASPAWARLSEATRKQRGNILTRVRKVSGDSAVTEIDRALIVKGRDSMSGAGAAKHFVQTMRGMFQWAKDAGHVDDDPTEGVKTARPATDGFHTWTEDEISKYEKRWPIGTRERLWFAVLLFTGFRRGDAVSIGQANIRDMAVHTRAAKTGTIVSIPLSDELSKIIEASPIGETTFIATIHGKPMSKEFFGNLFREACNKAGLRHCSAHGLRKAAATRLAEAGATVSELNAVFGWSGAKQALHYTTKADRAKLAKSAVERLKKS